LGDSVASSHVWSCLQDRLIAAPELEVVDCSAAAGLQGESRSGGDLLALTDWILPRLWGLPSAPLVLLAFGSCHGFLPVFWACLRLGIPVLPLALPRSPAEQQREARRVAHAYRGALLIHDEAGAAFAGAIAKHAVMAAFQGAGVNVLAVSKLCTLPAAALASPQLNPQAPAYLLETSGTTGMPRAACFDGSSEHAALLDRTVLWLFPLTSSSGISGAFALHRRSIFLPLPEAIRDPDHLFQLIEHHRITGFSMPPVLLTALLRHLRHSAAPLQQRDLSSLTRINIGSAASSAADIAALQDILAAWGLADGVIHTGYGLTETGLVAWGPFAADRALVQPPGEPLIGPLYEKVETRFVDGVLHVRKPFSFLGYLKNPCLGEGHQLAIEEFRSGEQWFDTGDRARLDDNGLVLCGRAKDIIVMNSRKFSLPAMEQSLQQCSAGLVEFVSACALPPRPGEANERLLLVLAPVAPLDCEHLCPDDLAVGFEQRLQAHLLAEFGVRAAAICLLASLQFPRTSTGKIRKAELLEWYQARHGAAAVAGASGLRQDSGLERELLAWVRQHYPHAQDVDRQQPLSAFGVDSLAFASLIGELERRHQCRCPLEHCPADPAIVDVVELFRRPLATAGQRDVVDSASFYKDFRHPSQIFLRHDYEQLVRAANLPSDGRPVGLAGMVHLHHEQASGLPLVLLTAWSQPVVNAIVRALPDHPVYLMRLAHDFATPANHRYLVFCLLEWLESCLAPLQRPYVLAGNCRAALFALELAQLLQTRQLEPFFSLLLQWAPHFLAADPLPAPYTGRVGYQLHRDHHGADPERSRQLLAGLRQCTPALGPVVLSGTDYSAEDTYPSGQHPCGALVLLMRQLVDNAGVGLPYQQGGDPALPIRGLR
jgi:acyl-CoA synthetase (AMP-forming)/AMP-acid ligase II/acyl carrier protein